MEPVNIQLKIIPGVLLTIMATRVFLSFFFTCPSHVKHDDNA